MSELEKAWMTLEEVANYVGVGRATVYNYMKDLDIKTQKFGRDRRGYISLADAKRIREYKENPWKVDPKVRNDTNKEAA